MDIFCKKQGNKASFPRVMLAAPASGSGKTLVTCGLLQVLRNRSIRTAAFKCGPDYIDPMFHTRVIGVPSRNLDTFFTDAQTTRYLFGRQAGKAEVSVMEGVMGFYDGVAGITTEASSWELARTVDTPVILVVNARGMSLSVVPLIEGFLKFPAISDRTEHVGDDRSERKRGSKTDESSERNGIVGMEETRAVVSGESQIRGVILNQTSASMYSELKREIEARLPVRVLGYVPRVDDCVIESRHLGLVTPGEIAGLKEKLQKLAEVLEKTLDIDGILALARDASDIDCSMPENLDHLFEKMGTLTLAKELGREPLGSDHSGTVKESSGGVRPVRIAVARDEAFCFYYADNLELLESLGAELVYFSPLHDASLPEKVQGLLLGGGYPELYAGTLSKNQSMLESVRVQIGRGMPYLAECGGFMYLHQSMEDMDGQSWTMAGVLPGRAYKTDRLHRFGYIFLTAKEPSGCIWLGSPGGSLRAHEFHYFDSTENGMAFHAQKPHRKRGWDCIVAGETYVAGFPHLYYYSNPQFAAHFLNSCRGYGHRSTISADQS